MTRRPLLAWLPFAALALGACHDAGPLAPAADEVDPSFIQVMDAAVPDLAPEPGSEGTDRYVPTLARVIRRALPVVRERAGAEAADRLIAHARTLQQDVQAAREAQDQAALREAVRKLEGFQAGVGVRVFGVKLVRHVHGDAASRLLALADRIQAAEEAGADVDRQKAGAQLVRRHLAAAREAAGKDKPVAALVHASQALDLVIRIAASL